MKILNSELIKPVNNKVIAEIIVNDYESNIIVESDLDSSGIESLQLYKGKVISYGETAKENAKLLKKGKVALFTEFAGYHLPIKDKLVKIINAYDIIAFNKGMEIKDNTVTPSHNRILVQLLAEKDSNKDLIVEDKDPRQVQLKYAKILRIGDSCNLGFKEGDLVGFEAFSGEIVREELSDEEPELVVLLEDLILFTINK